MLHKLISIILISASLWAQTPDNEKIEYLLNKIKNSELIFIRNGEEHTAKEAYEHLNFKLNYVKKAFFFFGPEKDIPIKDFVEKIASVSSSTDKPYYIRGKKLKKTPVKKWLYDQLKNFKSKNTQKHAKK